MIVFARWADSIASGAQSLFRKPSPRSIGNFNILPGSFAAVFQQHRHECFLILPILAILLEAVWGAWLLTVDPRLKLLLDPDCIFGTVAHQTGIGTLILSESQSHLHVRNIIDLMGSSLK
jgi:hypothetical protein